MKQILSILFFTILGLNLSAQKFYLGFNTGYGFATSAGQANLVNSEIYPENEIYEVIQGGYGEGINVGIFGGYSFTPHLGVELSSNYLFGRTLTTENTSFWWNQTSNEITTSRTAKMLQLTPKLVFRTKLLSSKIMPYAKLGIVFGLGSKMTEEIIEIQVADPFGRVDYESQQETTGNIPIGFSTNLGAAYQIEKNINLFAEFHLLNMSYSPEKIIITEHLYLDDLSTRQKETIYVDKIEYNDVLPPDNQPNEELRISLPFSNVSFNFGLRVNL